MTLKLNASKTMMTLINLNQAEFNSAIELKKGNIILPTEKNPKILETTFDPKQTFKRHFDNTSEKAEKTISILKALTSTTWGKQKETLLTTFKTITKPVMK